MGLVKKEYDKNYFENSFYKGKLDSQRNKNRVRELLTYKNGGKLLEIGCGEGNFIRKAEHYFKVSGLDVSEYAVDKAKKIFIDKVKLGNIEEIDLQPNCYDVIVAFNVLEHLKKPRNTIEKIYMTLNKEGVLMGSVPNNFGILGGMATIMTNIIDKTHCSTFSPNVWRDYFKEAGFKKILFFGEIPIGRNRNFYVKNVFWKFLSFNMVFVCEK